MSIRVRGLVTILGSGAVAGVLYLFLSFVLGHSAGSVRVPLVSAAPLVGVLVGMIELVSGVPFTQVAAKWDSLPQGMRLFLGTLLTVIALVVVFGGGIWLLNRITNP
jgi:hypothetical protein